MNHSYKAENIKKKLEKAADILALFAVMQYAVFRFLQSTMFIIYYSDTYKIITMMLLIIFGGVRYIYLLAKELKHIRKSERSVYIFKCAAIWCLALPFLYVAWKHNYKVLVFLPVCCMCLYGMEARKVLKAFLITISIALAATVLCCLSGTVKNLVRIEENGIIRSSYGIIISTDFAAYILFLVLIVWCNTQDRNELSFIMKMACAVMLFGGVWLFTRSRTFLFCGILTIAAFICNQIYDKIAAKRIKSISIVKWIKRCVVYSFAFVFLITILLLIWYKTQLPGAETIDNLLSNRLSETIRSYSIYGIHPFGSKIEAMHGNGGTLIGFWSGGYGYLDIAYAMLSIRYGWVIAGIVAAVWIWQTKRALQNGNRKIAIAMALLAIHAFSEARFLDVNYNILLIMPFCSYSKGKTGETNIILAEKRKWFYSTAVKLCLAGLIFAAMPKMLSWLRTFFHIIGFDSGISAAWSLPVSAAICILLALIWVCSADIIFQKNKKTVLALSCLAVLFIAGVVAINSKIDQEMRNQEERLQAEENVIRLVQDKAKNPVYAAEASELYQRKFGGFTDHFFSTDELLRESEGTIFTDIKTDSMAITNSGGLFFAVSPWTGVYTYDSEVISALNEIGFEGNHFYDCEHTCNISDFAVFNQLKTNKDDTVTVTGPIRVETKNAETDQYGGTYEVTFLLRLDDDKNPDDHRICNLEVMCETGEVLVHEEELRQIDFSENGRCKKAMVYDIGSSPGVTFTVSVEKEAVLTIEGISWHRIE